jgi:hypothetical protein
MSVNLDNAKVIKFTDDVQTELKNRESVVVEALKSAGMMYKTGVQAETVSFPTYGSFYMKDRGAYESQITASNPSVGRKTFQLKNYVSLIQTDIFQQSVVDFSEEKQVIKGVADAMNACKDQAMIDVLDGGNYIVAASGTSFNVGFYLSSTPEVFSVDTVKKINEYFNDLGIPQSQRLIFIDAAAERQLYNDQEYISTDYNKRETLKDGKTIHYILGFKIIVVPNITNEFGQKVCGLMKTGSFTQCYALHSEAVCGGEADLKVGSIVIQFDIDVACHKILSTLRVGYGIANNRGIVRFDVAHS